jgi:hypothetical protein
MSDIYFHQEDMMKPLRLMIALLTLSGCASMSNYTDIDSARLPFDSRYGEPVQVRTESNYFLRRTTYIYEGGEVVSFELRKKDLSEGWKISSY